MLFRSGWGCLLIGYIYFDVMMLVEVLFPSHDTGGCENVFRDYCFNVLCVEIVGVL